MDIKKTKVIINGIETSFTDTGTGEPVLILHGWGASSDYWMEISRRLASSGFRAIAMDFPGFGGSSAPNEVWGTSDYAEFVNNFTREIGLTRTHLIGHSFGGAVAMKLCFNNPEKFDKLILCDAAAIRGKKLGARQTAAKLMSDVGAGLIKKTPFYRFFQKIA
ncbi:MAG: alpha/beta hydrolase, partial [Candidatus Paceibacterota bacterium]